MGPFRFDGWFVIRFPPIVFQDFTRCLEFGNLGGFPAGTALLENPFEKFGGGFVRAAFATGEFSFGRDEVSFTSGFEDSGAVPLQVGLDALERSDRCIQPRELLFYLSDYSILCLPRSYRQLKRSEFLGVYVGLRYACGILRDYRSIRRAFQKIRNVFGTEGGMRSESDQIGFFMEVSKGPNLEDSQAKKKN